jgi:hypothetical protein
MLLLLIGAGLVVGYLAWQHDAADEATVARAAQQAENGYRVARAKTVVRRAYVEKTTEYKLITIIKVNSCFMVFYFFLGTPKISCP